MEASKNTNKELWRLDRDDLLDPDNYYAPSVHITADNKIGINYGGRVVEATPQEWVELAWETKVPANQSLNATPTAVSSIGTFGGYVNQLFNKILGRAH